MQEKLVTFKTAKLAKEKGFDLINVHDYYHINKGYNLGYALCISEAKKQTDGCLLAPTQSLLQKWLRKTYKIDVLPAKPNGNHSEYYIAKIYCNGTRLKWVGKSKIYEEALEVGLQEALKLINN